LGVVLVNAQQVFVSMCVVDEEEDVFVVAHLGGFRVDDLDAAEDSDVFESLDILSENQGRILHDDDLFMGGVFWQCGDFEYCGGFS